MRLISKSRRDCLDPDGLEFSGLLFLTACLALSACIPNLNEPTAIQNKLRTELKLARNKTLPKYTYSSIFGTKLTAKQKNLAFIMLENHDDNIASIGVHINVDKSVSRARDFESHLAESLVICTNPLDTDHISTGSDAYSDSYVSVESALGKDLHSGLASSKSRPLDGSQSHSSDGLRWQYGPYGHQSDTHCFFTSNRNYEPDHFDHRLSDEDVDSVYESLLAKNIILDMKLQKSLAKVYKKILGKMATLHIDGQNENWYTRIVQAWGHDNDFTHVLPVIQKHKLKDKVHELEHGENPILALDFILYDAKKLDGVGIGEEMKKQRDSFYRILVKERGIRADRYNGIPRSQYGIAYFDVPQLEAHGATPWQHWGRDTCHVDPDSSVYNRTVSRFHIPLRCGVSGTSTLAFWSLFRSGADLTEDEMRLFVLSVWAGLCADGGHTLQEVLSAAKLNAISASEGIRHDPKFRKVVSEMTVNSLGKVTKGIAPTGAEVELGRFGRYFESFFSKIKNKSFWKVRKQSQDELLEYLRGPKK